MAALSMTTLSNKRQFISLQGIPVKILVGAEGKCFYVHSSLLREHSEFFKAALNEVWQEGKERMVRLPEEQPAIFELYMQWLYTKRVFWTMEDRGADFERLSTLYGLGERIFDTVFQDSTMTAIVTASRTKDDNGKTWSPIGLNTSIIYENTPENSPA
ncbi:hypothetical protein LTR37_015957 [Vermiconidia calcicola]|uniref:Uncharacterized protein n=1 Tax=Vermiconidia calcicola TaxID=1690605 RepID=A0ACC3MPW4_9PEZI|nr:hypothetical protein LTR37_015957 [Vermiconidia calcicola]